MLQKIINATWFLSMAVIEGFIVYFVLEVNVSLWLKVVIAVIGIVIAILVLFPFHDNDEEEVR